MRSIIGTLLFLFCMFGGVAFVRLITSNHDDDKPDTGAA